MRVLIVEDDAIIAMHLAILVAELGYEVCATAASAAGAIAQASAHHPDVVLMDIRLAQGSSGVDAARELHATGPAVHISQREPGCANKDSASAIRANRLRWEASAAGCATTSPEKGRKSD